MATSLSTSRERLSRLFSLLDSLSSKQNANYCVEEILAVLKMHDDPNEFLTVFSDVLKGVLRSARSRRAPTRNCAGNLSMALTPYFSRQIRLEVLDQIGWKKLIQNQESYTAGKIGAELNGTSRVEYSEDQLDGETVEEYISRQRSALVARLNQGVAADEGDGPKAFSIKQKCSYRRTMLPKKPIGQERAQSEEEKAEIGYT